MTASVEQAPQWYLHIATALLLSVVSACVTKPAAGEGTPSLRIGGHSPLTGTVERTKANREIAETGNVKREIAKREIAKREIAKREIDWDRANADILHGSGGVANRKPHSAASRLLIQNTSEPIAVLVVPILLPAKSLHTNATAITDLEFSEPVIMLDTHGYTAVLKNKTIDIVIDATDSMLVTPEHRHNDTPADFDGSFQAIEGGGGEITIGRYGALYSIQLMCNRPSSEICVTECMVRDVIESLTVVELPADARP